MAKNYSEKSIPFLQTQDSSLEMDTDLGQRYYSARHLESSSTIDLNLQHYATTTTTEQPSSINYAERVKKILWKIFKATLGNRRLRLFLYRLLKIITVTYIQANHVLGSSETSAIRFALKIIAYIFMVFLCIITISRYARELTAVSKKKPLSIWLNWMEALLFSLYIVFSLLTAVFHIMFAASWYEVERIKPNHDKALRQQFSVFIVFVLLYVYNAMEMGHHYIHSGHSVSLFLTQAKPIPRRETKILLQETSPSANITHPYLQSLDMMGLHDVNEEKYRFNNRQDLSRSRYFADEDDEEDEDNYIPTTIRNQQLWRRQLNIGTISTLASTL
ncbi:hypothetical protein C9374_011056 [Naegleria lovaniensis]|uniref:Uncharacterized protein n=1 Tax=Naegleria lovaniensis TaxID=51637 RepID=A0AA88GGL3_NAELO|nr:uncharacterized protein C9374_011056 [Naegleria lovaniensis]KAG2374219.1 hypothetical protein C9374_011056 [Naegleria lovaniensis]